MRISLVIPFYNPMPLFNELLESIYKNMNEIDDHSNFEFIFVNDGSTDDYMCALKPFMENFDSAKLISIENSGVAFARNVGVENASGDYVWYVDADDFVAPHSFVNILNCLEGLEVLPDILFCNGEAYDDQSGEYYGFSYKYSLYMSEVIQIESDSDRSRVYDILFNKVRINYAIWYQLFRRDFLIENEIKFDCRLKTSEDLDYKFRTLSRANSVYGLDEITYTYRAPNNTRSSLSKTPFTPEHTILLSEMKLHWYNYYEKLMNTTTDEAGGFARMRDKFALLVFSAQKLLKRMEDNQAVKDYLADKDSVLGDVYQRNKEYLDRVTAEIKSGNFINI